MVCAKMRLAVSQSKPLSLDDAPAKHACGVRVVVVDVVVLRHEAPPQLRTCTLLEADPVAVPIRSDPIRMQTDAPGQNPPLSLSNARVSMFYEDV